MLAFFIKSYDFFSVLFSNTVSSGKSRVVAVPPSSSPWSRCPFSPFHDPTPSGGEINGLLEICAVFLLLHSHPFAARNVSVLWTSFPFRAIV